MTVRELIITVAVGLLVNEATEVGPWLAVRIVRLSARFRYGASDIASVRAEELAALVLERPGKLLKVLTALGFLGGGLITLLMRRFRLMAAPLTVVLRPAKRHQLEAVWLRSASDCLTSKELRLETMGVVGGWGTGKTTAMKALSAYLGRAEHSLALQRSESEVPVGAAGENVVTAWYNPWLTGSESSPWHAIVAEIHNGVLKAGLPPVSAHSMPPEIRLVEAVAALGSTGLMMVVFVDDLDRCHPETAFETLEAMKRISFVVGNDNVKFVMGFDPEAIKSTMTNPSLFADQTASPGIPAQFTQDYLDKSIQLLVPVLPGIQRRRCSWTRNTRRSLIGLVSQTKLARTRLLGR